jgi:glucosamine-6-phosphate deaminase
MTTLPPIRFSADHLAVEIHADRRLLGVHAARAAGRLLRDIIGRQDRARVIFACAPSQDEFLDALVDPAVAGPIAWERITAFHMDDYVGLTAQHPQSFRAYLQAHLLSRVTIGEFHPIAGERSDLTAVCADYAARLDEAPIDLICLGIGENGHLAFNDPPVADFNDPALIKLVELDESCRRQQVNDGCFATLADVPRHALSLTLPVFRDARHLSVHVPGPRKAAAVKATLEGPVSTACPASLLREHPAATLFLDTESAAALALRA